jgi:branched-chain amino acid transport system substrate-binding protein
MEIVPFALRHSARPRRPRLLAAAALAGAALLAGNAMADVKIGILMPLSGKGASYGLQQQVAIQMVQDELAKSGVKGEKLQLISYDTRGENAEAISLTRRLISTDKVLAIIGPYLSAETEVAFPAAVQGKTPIITASAAKPGIATRNRPWAFRNALSSDQMDSKLVDAWLAANPGIKSVVVLTDIKDAFTKVDGTSVFPDVLKAHGIKVLDNISFQTADIDFAAQVTKAKQLNPDGLVVAGLYNEGGNVVREIRKQGLKQPVIGALGMSSPRYLEIAGAAAEDSMVVMPFWPDNPDPRVAKWSAEYIQRSKSTPANTDALMYDTLHIVTSCIESSGVTNKEADLAADRERIRSCLEKMPTFAGIVGPVRFNADGDAVLQPTVLQAKAGKWIAVK